MAPREIPELGKNKITELIAEKITKRTKSFIVQEKIEDRGPCLS